MGKTSRKFIRYTAKELANARETDMIDFLEKYNGYMFKKEGSDYRCREHNSLVIRGNRKRWYWNERDIGGNNVLDWLQSIENLDFQTACGVVINKYRHRKKFATAPQVQETEKKPFQLPEATKSQYTRVYAYLAYTRNINHEVLKYCFDNKILYQDTKNNAVFVGYNENGVAAFCEQKSTSLYPYAYAYKSSVLELQLPQIQKILNQKWLDRNTLRSTNFILPENKDEQKPFKEMKGKKFRGNIESSDKRYSFHIDSENQTDRVFVFEAPIDLLAHCTINNMKAKSVGNPDWQKAFRNHNRVSLSGTTTVALDSYLTRHPEIKRIVVCTDNDTAGKTVAEKISRLYSQVGYSVTYMPSKYGKDYSEYLDLIKKNYQKKQNSNQIENCCKR